MSLDECTIVILILFCIFRNSKISSINKRFYLFYFYIFNGNFYYKKKRTNNFVEIYEKENFLCIYMQRATSHKGAKKFLKNYEF